MNIAKVFHVGRWRYDARLEAFNLLNNSADRTHAGVTGRPCLNATTTTGCGLGTTVGAQASTLFERATNVIDARVLRVAVTARF
jgi:hydroxyethylthiazole kinase-like sugar kinase family protein